MNRIYTGDEHFTFDGMPTNHLVSDFWSWFSSDLLNNITRGILAEYIVSNALGIDTSGMRQSWEPFDISFNEKKIEIKSSAYIQSWHKDGQLSAPIFGIAPTYSYDNREVVKRSRKAALYIFCLLDCLNRNEIDPIKLEQWRFFVLPTTVLDERCGEQKSLTLNALKALNPTETTYETLKSVVMQYAKEN